MNITDFLKRENINVYYSQNAGAFYYDDKKMCMPDEYELIFATKDHLVIKVFADYIKNNTNHRNRPTIKELKALYTKCLLIVEKDLQRLSEIAQIAHSINNSKQLVNASN